jgi:replicative DNA helicase
MTNPPNNPSAESALVGAVLFDNRNLYRAQEYVKTDNFYVSEYRAIWAACVDLSRQGKVADPVTLKEHFEPQLLADLLDSACFGPEIDDYARIVADCAQRRALIEAGNLLAKDAEGGSADDALDEHERTIEGIRESAGTSEPFQSLKDITLNALANREARLDRIIATGFPSIDQTIGGLEQGTFSVLGARPGMGKTVLGICLGGNIAEAGETVGYFSLEMPSEDIGFRLGAWEAWKRGEGNVPAFSEIKMATTTDEQESRIISAMRQDHVERFLVNDRGRPSLKALRRQIRSWNRNCRRKGWPVPRVIIVDHMGHVTPDQAWRGTYERVTEVSNGLLAIAKEFDVAVLALSQLNRASSREGARPSLHDLRDSGAVEQDANLVMFLHREDYYLRKAAEAGEEGAVERLRQVQGQAECIIAKARSGPTSTIHMKHSIGHNVFRDLAWKERRAAA